jgi:DNA-directed RNA polymerase subunit RPC12/RpoP
LSRIKTQEQFIEECKIIHGNRYDYSKSIYKRSREKICIVCRKCNNEFKQDPISHLRGGGCPHCLHKHEGKIKELVYKYFKGWTIFPHKKIWDIYKDYKHKRYCDFWLEKNNIRIMLEYDGHQFNLTGCL